MHTYTHTHIHPLSRAPCALQNSGEEARPPGDQCVGAGKERAWGEKVGSQEALRPPELYSPSPGFPLKVLLSSLRYTWQWAAHAHRHTRTSAHNRSPPKRCPWPFGVRIGAKAVHTHVPRQVHSRACLQIPGQSCTRAQARAPRAGCRQSQGKLGRTHSGFGALQVSITGLQRPLVVLPRLTTDTPSPVFSLPLSLGPSPALPPVESSSYPAHRAQVSR